MAFGDTWSGRMYGEEFWDWMWGQRGPSDLCQALLDSARQADTLVEIGCGAGHFMERLARSGWRGRFLGYDFSPAALRAARRRKADNRVRGRLTQGDFMTKRIPKADLVVSCGVLQHQPDWLLMVERCLQAAPRVAFGIGYVDRSARRNSVEHYEGHSDWRFSPRHTREILRAANVEIIESRVSHNPLRRKRDRWEWFLIVGA